MRGLKRMGIRWGTVFLVALIMAFFNPGKEDFKNHIVANYSALIAFHVNENTLAQANYNQGAISTIVIDGSVGTITPSVSEKRISRENLYIFSIHEYDYGYRAETYIGILNRFIMIK